MIRLRLLVSSFLLSSSIFSLDAVLCLVLLADSFAILWIAFLKFCQSICGFFSSLVVASLSRLSSFFCRSFPWVMTLSIRGFSFMDGRYHVHLLLPISGASFGANLTETS